MPEASLPVPTDFADPHLYLNRELSLLRFNGRVLAQAQSTDTPLLERLRFLAITSTNLDEFFEVRAASHKERATHGTVARTVDGRTSAQTLVDISSAAHELVERQYRVLNDTLLPALRAAGVHLLKRAEWNPAQTEWISSYFAKQVLPVLTPMGLDPSHPFPRILNKSLNFVVLVQGEDAYGRDANIGVVQVPRALPRVIALPDECASSDHDFILLSSIVHAHIERLFPGMDVIGCYQFRVTRNGDLWVDEEEVEDLLQAMQGELPERGYSEAVRLEVAGDCPGEVAAFLLAKFDLGEQDLYRVDGPVNLNRLGYLRDLVDRPDLKYQSFTPRIPQRSSRGGNAFEAMAHGDILLHHPYESFSVVIDFLRQAANDPNVLAIKQTLYRTGDESAIVELLIEAALKGKQVTVVVELRARFDEANNIDLATRLQEVGAIVVYGTVGYKTHAKTLLVVRRENGQLRRYCHLGTGNYHPGTARAYTDIGYLTAAEDIGEDLHRFFTQLTGLGEVQPLEVLLQSPFTLHRALLQRIDAEAKRARVGRPARIVAKMNALTEPAVIRELYRASQAGVQIDLLIRGACCLRPGVPGVSDNIRVLSIVGRFLEHSRLYYFLGDQEPELWCSSADWMTRNLRRRVEICFPIRHPKIRERLLREDLLNYLEPGVRAWHLQQDGSYVQTSERTDTPVHDAQLDLLVDLCGFEQD
ncbi:MAG: polyphosphate kinase [Planctomycetota bacterium]|jgi:polyphosphate kinase